jgi:hypothetical protein
LVLSCSQLIAAIEKRDLAAVKTVLDTNFDLKKVIKGTVLSVLCVFRLALFCSLALEFDRQRFFPGVRLASLRSPGLGRRSELAHREEG